MYFRSHDSLSGERFIARSSPVPRTIVDETCFLVLFRETVSLLETGGMEKNLHIQYDVLIEMCILPCQGIRQSIHVPWMLNLVSVFLADTIELKFDAQSNFASARFPDLPMLSISILFSFTDPRCIDRYSKVSFNFV